MSKKHPNPSLLEMMKATGRQRLDLLQRHLQKELKTPSDSLPPVKRRLQRQAEEIDHSSGLEYYQAILEPSSNINWRLFITINYNWANQDAFRVEGLHAQILSALKRNSLVTSETKYLLVVERHKAPAPNGRPRFHSHILMENDDTVPQPNVGPMTQALQERLAKAKATDLIHMRIYEVIESFAFVASVDMQEVYHETGVLDYSLKALGWNSSDLHIDFMHSTISWPDPA